MAKYVARVSVRESHPDGTARMFEKTAIVDGSMTIRELMDWRSKRVHDPLNGEFAATEVIVTPDDEAE